MSLGRYITTTDPLDVRPDQLHIEMESVSGYLRLLTGADVVELLFDDDPTAGQIDDSDAVLAAHVPGAKDVKIHRYVANKNLNVLVPPVDIDYVTGLTQALFSVVESSGANGPIQIVHYASAEQDVNFNVTYSDPVVVEDYSYTLDEFDVVRRTDMTISWILENGDPHDTTKVVTTFS